MSKSDPTKSPWWKEQCPCCGAKAMDARAYHLFHQRYLDRCRQTLTAMSAADTEGDTLTATSNSIRLDEQLAVLHMIEQAEADAITRPAQQQEADPCSVNSNRPWPTYSPVDLRDSSNNSEGSSGHGGADAN